MKIGIDARLLERKMTGIGRYLENIVERIPEFDRENQYVLFSCCQLPGFPKENVSNVFTSDAATGEIFKKIKSALWLHAVLPQFLRKEKIDILFSPNTLLPIGHTGTKNIITICDLFQLVDPRFHSWFYRIYVSFFLSRTLKKMDHVLTISEASKRDIIRFLHIPEEKITVTYLAADERFTPRVISSEDRVRFAEKYGLPDRFILYVGVLEKRKNIDGIIKIADDLRSKTDVPIILAGRIGHGGNEYVSEIKRRSNMRYLGFPDDIDLPYLYNLAEIFLFPSLYEGFGLPPLEAMQSGIPVIASNTSSLPEVIGDAGILLAPEDHEGSATAILELLGDSRKRSDLVQKGLKQAKRFSFEKTARETIDVLRNIA
jgi:glycosyltransferase involved in cell wall biosynthesis